jgi:hypothetical protein
MYSKVHDVLALGLKAVGIVLISPFLIIGWPLINIFCSLNRAITPLEEKKRLDDNALKQKQKKQQQQQQQEQQQQEQGRLAIAEFYASTTYSQQKAHFEDAYNTQQKKFFSTKCQ